jgi:integration host factor subunit alpha
MTKTLTKDDLIQRLYDRAKISREEAREVVESFFKVLIERLISGEKVNLYSFGNFILRDKKERPGRNPKTMKEAIISARRLVTFRAGQKLKDRVAG